MLKISALFLKKNISSYSHAKSKHAVHLCIYVHRRVSSDEGTSWNCQIYYNMNMKNNKLQNFVTAILTKHKHKLQSPKKPGSTIKSTRFITQFYMCFHCLFTRPHIVQLREREFECRSFQWTVQKSDRWNVSDLQLYVVQSCVPAGVCCRVFEEAVNSSCLHVVFVRWFPLARVHDHLASRK
jgi:hypothetical protein